jgi:hypothetical protein
LVIADSMSVALFRRSFRNSEGATWLDSTIPWALLRDIVDRLRFEALMGISWLSSMLSVVSLGTPATAVNGITPVSGGKAGKT